MRAIKTELGDNDAKNEEIRELREKILAIEMPRIIVECAVCQKPIPVWPSLIYRSDGTIGKATCSPEHRSIHRSNVTTEYNKTRIIKDSHKKKMREIILIKLLRIMLTILI
jgi:hypothetical protein